MKAYLRQVQRADVISDYRSCWLAGERSLLCCTIAVGMKAIYDSSPTSNDSSSGSSSSSGGVETLLPKRPKCSLGLGVREMDGFIVVTSFKYDDDMFW